MIYSPAHYKENRNDLIYQIIRDYGFATIISPSADGAVVSHLPLLLEVSSDGVATLLGHCARANPHWRQFSVDRTLTAIFHGPHSYISPAWYEPKDDNVPTWNYAAVHVQGVASVIADESEVFEVLRATTQKFETDYGTGWSLPPRPGASLTELLRHIVAFRIEIKDIQAKFKLSQKKQDPDRDNVILNLSKMGESQQQVARLMSEVTVGTVIK